MMQNLFNILCKFFVVEFELILVANAMQGEKCKDIQNQVLPLESLYRRGICQECPALHLCNFFGLG